MVFPRFTIRTLLAVTALCAVLFLVLGLAFRGQSLAWAGGLLIAVASVVLTAATHIAWFGVVALFARLSPRAGSVPQGGAAQGLPSDRPPTKQEAPP